MAPLNLKPIFKLNYTTFTKMLTKNLEVITSEKDASPKIGSERDASQKFTFEDRAAIVTGGASGIGFAIAKELLRNGLTAVNIIDVNEEKLEESSDALKEEFGEDRVVSSKVDVADTKQMDNAFKSSVEDFEGIDIVVNNAGIMDDTNWESQLNTNIRGPLLGTLLGLQYMAKTSSGDGGIIVNVGSSMSVLPACGFPIHTLTQFGIAGFTRALGSSKLFERTGVKVFGYCPSLTDTAALNHFEDKVINNNFAAEFEEENKDVSLQNPIEVAKGLVEILEEAKPGSIWIKQNGKSPFELEIPKILERKKAEQHETQGSLQLPTKASETAGARKA